MTDRGAIWVKEEDIVNLVSLREAIPALEAGLSQEYEGKAANMSKTHAIWNQKRSTLHALGAVMEGSGIVGTKTWAHTPGGACPLLILFNSENGALLAVLEAFALGQMRTAGISGVATRWMSREDAGEMALIGTGKQSLPQVAGIYAVRELKKLRVFSPNSEHRDAFIEKARKQFPFDIVAADSVEQAVDNADIVTLVTRAREAFLSAEMLKEGCHINAVGAITPEREEFTQDVFDRSDIVAVDNIDSVRRLSTEFMKRYGDDEDSWKNVQRLSTLVGNGKERHSGADLTLFKAMGMGLSDLSLAIRILELAHAAGVGTVIPQPKKTPPRMV